MSDDKTIRYKTAVVLLPGGEYTRAELERILSLMDRANETMRKATEPVCHYPNCPGGQNGTVCHKHCPTPCPDCRGIGYDASGQLCACQDKPAPSCAYPNCVGGQAGTICKPSCPGGTK